MLMTVTLMGLANHPRVTIGIIGTVLVLTMLIIAAFARLWLAAMFWLTVRWVHAQYVALRP